ncbi:NADH-quinone oxidoreductase subunit J [Pantoea sp. Mhis]|uniref:NADH-quinone oxidoreductase subunit J n=1 Tax=Pantoea sp. Mhis TaxID=2576759 RepID=UPI00135A1353|nr:NADH-quinone oxidoreductase subunit J [Pantoea sp. Mhis]MXP56099.1 NADH-quinone oxidoreductase subunit J [Pantoea sp. Mhis]
MEFIFYFCGIVAVLTTIRFIIHTNPIHALLYLMASLLSIAGIFFSLGAYFAGAIEIIIYAGAIMVLFIFIIMILNVKNIQKQELQWLKSSVCIGSIIISFLLLSLIIYAIKLSSYHLISSFVIDTKSIGIALFSPYILAVELISILLLIGLVVVLHLGSGDTKDKF